ncbi:hypothetical protein BJ994_001748 [Arthrobacter pigmenti]|uniref:Uncharacterized protein n=1 Tax=Arthrobacter pigmenti TaxID=271432 RepID=A0A846RQ12_9MICC|nr:hypothetical protein [Arthrobacter pigmenti]NJC22672.1 hypothetical protein [Arthrobacter pigmenti]
MTGRTRTRNLLALPRAVFTMLGLTAVIIGILAMHIWMGGHGPTATHGSHPTTGPVIASHQAMAAADNGTHTGTAAETHKAIPAVHPGGTVDLDQGCVGSCGDEGMALGMCMLALIVVTVLAFLLPAYREVSGTAVLRGPPTMSLRALSIPVPSLIRLCISRT